MLTRLWACRMKSQEFDSWEGRWYFREICYPFLTVCDYTTIYFYFILFFSSYLFIFIFTLSLFSLHPSQSFLLRPKIFLNFSSFPKGLKASILHTLPVTVYPLVLLCFIYNIFHFLISHLYITVIHIFILLPFIPIPSSTLLLTALYRSTWFLVFFIFPIFILSTLHLPCPQCSRIHHRYLARGTVLYPEDKRQQVP
jgi:hypothetical protein